MRNARDHVDVGRFASLAVDPVRVDVLTQSDSRARFGNKPYSYFFIEAEDFHDNDPRGDGDSWILTSEPDAMDMIINDFSEDPDTGELVEPDPEAFASGGESITNVYKDIRCLGGDVSMLDPELNRNQNDSFYYPNPAGFLFWLHCRRHGRR